ncbi:hypothetical protein PybrP1_006445 [[Pythium] brassicae (nom. inval.)]|nr:hypothetical protein PybrP1_006445 [[Pythium] brassicae (nom. inval.)]
MHSPATRNSNRPSETRHKVNFSSSRIASTSMEDLTGRVYEADGDAIMRTVQQTVFEFMEAPKPTDRNHDALVKWTQRRRHYEDRVRQRCAECGERLEVVLASIKVTVEPKLLEVISLYELQNAAVDVPDLDGFFKQHLIIDMREDDINAQIFKYYRDFSSLIKKNGFGSILGVDKPSEGGYADRMKLRCTVLIDNLEPLMIRDDVQRYLKNEYREARRNDFTWFGVIKERARAQPKYHVMTRERKAKAPPLKKDKFEELAPSKLDAAPKPYDCAAAELAKPGTIAVGKTPPATGCWRCKGVRWLRDWMSANEADKARAIEHMKEIRGSSRARMKISKTPGIGDVIVNGLLSIPYCADSGSGDTYLLRQALDELKSLGSRVVDQMLLVVESITVAGGITLEC